MPEGISRGVLVALAQGSSTIGALALRFGVSSSTIFTLLERHRLASLVTRERALRGEAYVYEISAAGRRRVDWIKKYGKKKS